MKFWSKYDLTFLIGSTLILLGIALVELSFEFAPQPKPTGQRIGLITYKNHYAERKLEGVMLWTPVTQDGPLFNEDTIRTAADSSAVLHLQNGVDISMSEETMVVVQLAAGQAKLSLGLGQIGVAHVPPSSKKGAQGGLVISTSAGQVKVLSGALTVGRKADGQADVHVIAGEAQVTEGGKVHTLSPKDEPVELLKPDLGAVFIKTQPQIPVDFSWKTARPGYDQNLVIALDASFKRVVLNQQASSPLKAALGDGDYFWKLTGPDGDSRASWFSVRSVLPPTLVTPEKGKQFTYFAGYPSLSFSWLPLEVANYYKVTVTDALTGTVEFTQSTFQNTLVTSQLGAGAYQWKVAAYCGPQNIEVDSQPLAFTIQQVSAAAPLLQPVQPSGNKTQVFSGVALKQGAIVAKWNNVEGADHYDVTVSKHADGTEVVLKKSVITNSLRLDKKLDDGQYYLTVTAVSNQVSSPESAPMPFQVANTQPLIPQHPNVQDELDPGQSKVFFDWRDPNQGGNYRVLVSSTLNMKTLIATHNSTNTSCEISLPADLQGMLYWQVQLQNDQGVILSQSPVQQFSRPRRLSSPVPLTPIADFGVDAIYVPEVQLRWKPSPDANYYQVRLYQILGGFKVLYKEWRGWDTTAAWSFLELGKGKYAWELVSQERENGYLLGQSPAVISYFRVIQSHSLAAPATDITVLSGD